MTPANTAHVPPDPSRALETARHHLAAAADRLALPDPIRRRLIHAKEQITLQLHPALPCGKSLECTAYIVRHSDVLGPAKGGSRVAEGINARGAHP